MLNIVIYFRERTEVIDISNMICVIALENIRKMNNFWSVIWIVSYSVIIQKYNNAASPEWKLVWADEFKEEIIDLNKWSFDLGDGCHLGQDLCGWGNKELQWYTNSSDNAFIANGHLVIQARRENSKERRYTSARMVTYGKGDWRFVRIEVRAKFPQGKGFLPLIWMLPSYKKYGEWPASGEIDIASLVNPEHGNKISTIAHFGRFYDDLTHVQEYVHTKPGQLKFSDDFHIFAVDRDINDMTWYVNDEVVMKCGPKNGTYYTYPFNERYHLVLSLAVGGLGGNPEDTPFPKRLEIDYVRVYEK